MLTMLEDMEAEIPGLAEWTADPQAPGKGPGEPGAPYYVWSVPGYAESPEVVRPEGGEGYWRTVKEAYADLQAFLLAGHEVMPSTAQIVLWFAFQPHVTHVVRIG